MKNLKFKTNINCGGCIAAVTPHLNALKGVTNWSVDTNNPSKILTVETEEATPSQIINILSAVGYKAELLAGFNGVSPQFD
jgi:copper chaperone